MPDGNPITDPETIAAYVRIARIVYGIDDDQHGLSEIDNPPTVVEPLGGAKVRVDIRGRQPANHGEQHRHPAGYGLCCEVPVHQLRFRIGHCTQL
jgi:hypothetical protein